MKGTYRESQRSAYDLADKIIFLDTPLYKRRLRIITRSIKQKVGLEKSNNKPTFEMLKHMFKWTADFERKRETHENRLISLVWKRSLKMRADLLYEVLARCIIGMVNKILRIYEKSQ